MKTNQQETTIEGLEAREEAAQCALLDGIKESDRSDLYLALHALAYAADREKLRSQPLAELALAVAEAERAAWRAEMDAKRAGGAS